MVASIRFRDAATKDLDSNPDITQELDASVITNDRPETWVVGQQGRVRSGYDGSNIDLVEGCQSQHCDATHGDGKWLWRQAAGAEQCWA